ncbi:MAG: chromosome partitioning protein, ParB family [Parcubacteria group bacterium Gr01-1014_66]|nr:MAG: chromosome partitioning protein, ParB family [Parcubacteria group bacterium Gr01-1014_66]
MIPSRVPEKEGGAKTDPLENLEDAVARTSDVQPDAGATLARTYEDHFTPRRGESIFWVELEKIEPNPFQPRRAFDEDALQQLAHSIREHGVLQPVLVTKREVETPQGIEVRYQLIAGERRLRAARLAGLSQIPAIIRRGIPDDRIRLELALIENVQREDLNAIERGRAFKQLIDEFHLVQRELAERIGKSREVIANTIRLLTLPEDIQNAMIEGKISEGHARAILMAGDNSEQQHQVYDAVVMDRLTVREAESKARQVGGKELLPRKRASSVSTAQDPEWKAWQHQLAEHLGVRVILQKIGERGKIVVEFQSGDELRSLVGKLIQEI